MTTRKRYFQHVTSAVVFVNRTCCMRIIRMLPKFSSENGRGEPSFPRAYDLMDRGWIVTMKKTKTHTHEGSGTSMVWVRSLRTGLVSQRFYVLQFHKCNHSLVRCNIVLPRMHLL